MRPILISDAPTNGYRAAPLSRNCRRVKRITNIEISEPSGITIPAVRLRFSVSFRLAHPDRRYYAHSRRAEQTPEKLRDTIKALDGDDVDAIIQVGTNLSNIRLAAAAELFLGKPVIAINTATYWHALRANGFTEQKAGFGRLMSDF